MPDSGKFKDLYLNSAHTYPCQPPPPSWGVRGAPDLAIDRPEVQQGQLAWQARMPVLEAVRAIPAPLVVGGAGRAGLGHRQTGGAARAAGVAGQDAGS